MTIVIVLVAAIVAIYTLIELGVLKAGRHLLSRQDCILRILSIGSGLIGFLLIVYMLIFTSTQNLAPQTSRVIWIYNSQNPNIQPLLSGAESLSSLQQSIVLIGKQGLEGYLPGTLVTQDMTQALSQIRVSPKTEGLGTVLDDIAQKYKSSGNIIPLLITDRAINIDTHRKQHPGILVINTSTDPKEGKKIATMTRVLGSSVLVPTDIQKIVVNYERSVRYEGYTSLYLLTFLAIGCFLLSQGLLSNFKKYR